MGDVERSNLLPEGFELRQGLARRASRFTSVAWSPDGRFVAASGLDGLVWVFDTAGKTERVLAGHSDWVRSVAWSPDGSRLASGSNDNTVRIWETATGKAERVLDGHGARVLSVAWSADGSRLASGSLDHSVRVWEAATGKTEHVLKGHTSSVLSVAWSADGSRLASGSADKTVRVWEAATGKTEHVLKGHKGYVQSVAWSADGSRLASGSGDMTVRVWEAATRKARVLEGHTAAVTWLCWSPDRRTLWSSTESGEIRVWDADSGASLGVIEGTEYHYPAFNVAVVPKTSLAAGFEDDSFRIRSFDSFGEVLETPEQVSFSSAKVVFFGESAVGKSCLALRLAEDRFEDLPATHGMKVWKVPAGVLDPGAAAPAGARREVFLWDFGGHDEYRLVHQLFLHDTTLALFLFHPTRGARAFEDVEEWDQQLRAQLKERKVTKLLVRTKTDIETGEANTGRVEKLRNDRQFADYCELSAKENTGVPEFRTAIGRAIGWDQIDEVSRPVHFQATRDHIETKRKSGDVVLYHRDLEEWFLGEYPEKAEGLETVVGQLGQQGLLSDLRLATGERVLVLQVEEVERYAGSIVLVAREAARESGVPAVESKKLLSPEMVFPKIDEDERLKRGDERVVLECVIQLLVEKNLCLEHEGLLVFPHLFESLGAAGRDELAHRVPIYYDFSGAIDNIYSSLVVRLHLSGDFGAVRMWQDRVEYQTTSGGLFGLRKVGDRKGLAHLNLYFDGKTKKGKRDLFIGFVDEHLRKEGVDITDILTVRCPCGETLEERVLRERLVDDKTDVGCPKCDRRHDILTAGGSATRESTGVAKGLVALRTNIERATTAAVATVKEVFREPVTKKTKEPIRILHLSDLHLRGGDKPVELLQPLLADLRNGLNVKSVDYLVVSGDFADKCNEKGFSVAGEFLSGLIEELDLSAARCVLVPGNHDYVQELKSFEMVDDPKGYDRAIQQGAIHLVPHKTEYEQRFRLFADCYRKLRLKDYPLAPAQQFVVDPFEDTKIQFLSLNSAWRIDKFGPKDSAIHNEALSNGLLKAKDGYLGIAVWHHAVTGNDKIEETAFVERLSQKGFRLCLHGDVHAFRPDMVNPYDEQKRLHVAGGGSFAARAKDRPPSTPRMYNLLEIKRDHSRVRVHTREQRSRNAAFSGFAFWPVRSKKGLKREYYDIRLK
jgi:WD40 repeat protein